MNIEPNEEKKIDLPRSKRAKMLKEGIIAQLNIDVQPGIKKNMAVAAAVHGKKLSKMCEIALYEWLERQKEIIGSERSSVWQSVTLPKWLSMVIPENGGLTFLIDSQSLASNGSPTVCSGGHLSHTGNDGQSMSRQDNRNRRSHRPGQLHSAVATVSA